MKGSKYEFITEKAPVSDDERAKKELEFLISADENRKERVREVFNKIFIIVLWISFLLIIAVLVTRVIHIVVPDSFRWLEKEDIAQMDKFLFSSALGGLVGKYFDNIINGSETD